MRTHLPRIHINTVRLKGKILAVIFKLGQKGLSEVYLKTVIRVLKEFSKKVNLDKTVSSSIILPF